MLVEEAVKRAYDSILREGKQRWRAKAPDVDRIRVRINELEAERERVLRRVEAARLLLATYSVQVESIDNKIIALRANLSKLRRLQM